MPSVTQPRHQTSSRQRIRLMHAKFIPKTYYLHIKPPDGRQMHAICRVLIVNRQGSIINRTSKTEKPSGD